LARVAAAAPAAAASVVAPAPVAAAAFLAAPAAPASEALPSDLPPSGGRFARGLKAVPAAFGRLGRLSFEGLRGALGRAFDGSDTRPAPPVPADPADRIEFNGLVLPRRAFSDESRISAALVPVIDAARQTLDVAVHGLQLREVGTALARAKARGVRVRIVMNETHVWPRRSGEKRSPEVQALLDAGFEMRALRGSREYGVMHNKFLVADGRLLWAGSYNWTRAADDMHLENVFLSDDAHRIAGYQGYWRWMWDQSRPAAQKPPDAETGPEPPGAPPEDASRPVSFNGTALPAYAFGPRGPAEPWLAAAVGAARRSVDVAMFSFTSPELRDALAAARARGVKVRLLFDARNAATLDVMKWFIAEGFDVRIRAGRDGRRGVLHNKFAVFDGALVEAGSYNWTENADKNSFENVNFFDDAPTAKGYGAYFDRMWSGGKLPTPAELEKWSSRD
jgi:phosphatidylserine/phosphatidylglycerophosphate/cardiolipin synthase-like enzyme